MAKNERRERHRMRREEARRAAQAAAEAPNLAPAAQDQVPHATTKAIGEVEQAAAEPAPATAHDSSAQRALSVPEGLPNNVEVVSQTTDSRGAQAQPLPAAASVATQATVLDGASSPRPRSHDRRSHFTACFVDFENLFFTASRHHEVLSVPRVAKLLSQLSRRACGDGWAYTQVYANWDGVVTESRHAQDDWSIMGYSTCNVPTREDYLTNRTVKNLVDFRMSLDMLELARDNPHWDHFVIVSGDGDFCEVAERLKRLRRRVWVVALKPSLSYRLGQAAEEHFVWSFEDVCGPHGLPSPSYSRMVASSSPAGAEGTGSEDLYQALLRLVRKAVRDHHVPAVLWSVVRDEYLCRSVRIAPAKADEVAHQLHQGGFVSLVKQTRNGKSDLYISVPR
jgi:uncharacterized LabA/DUF88 family protein